MWSKSGRHFMENSEPKNQSGVPDGAVWVGNCLTEQFDTFKVPGDPPKFRGKPRASGRRSASSLMDDGYCGVYVMKHDGKEKQREAR